MRGEASAEEIMTRYARKAKMEQMWMEGKNMKEICAYFGLKRKPSYIKIRDLKAKKFRNKMAKLGILGREIL